MPNYKRARHGNTYFFTVVTYKRSKILCIDSCVNALREIIKEVQAAYPFKIEAFVLLPDHIHCIWKLPDGDMDYSMRWGLIKKEFTKRVRSVVGTLLKYNKNDFTGQAAHPTKSRARHREGMIWQRRFWEHQIKDDNDFRAHCDYVHYNPVKHRLVNAPKDWPHSTFNRYVRDGLYDPQWGAGHEMVFDDSIGNE